VTPDQVRTLVLFALVVGGMYLLLIRPTRKRAQEVRTLQNALRVGAEVMLTSGIFGRVRSIDDEKVQVEVSDGVVLTVHRGAIGKVLTPPDDADGGDSDQIPADEIGNDPDDPDVEPGDTVTGTDPGTDDDPDDSDEPRGAH
jgi:preprotein translocase subunit YajC